MIRYNAEEKKVEEAIQQVYRDFAKEYNRILREDTQILSDAEVKEEIDYILFISKQSEETLQSVQSLSELSEDEKELIGVKEESEPKKVDTDVINTLVSVYAKRAKMPSKRIDTIGILEGITLKEEELKEIDTSAFEGELRKYLTEHYSDLLSNGYNDFLSEVTEVADEGILGKKNGELIEIAIKHNLDPKKFSCFGYQLTVQDGLVAEEDSTLGTSNIFYASPEAINKRIYDLYSRTLFKEQKSNGKYIRSNEDRELKNTYITYAEKNGIEIQNKDVLEELPIDMNKVQGVATYINRVLNENGTISNNMTEEFATEIQKDYSKIMNLTLFNFGELETVKRVSNDRYMSLYLHINDNNIIKTDEFSPDIAYGTQEYIKSEYQRVMNEIKRLSHTDAFKEGYFDVEKVNKQKEALRRYIIENEIEGIDISIPEVEIDHQRTGMIASALLNRYGKEYEDQEGMRARILKKVEDRYPEMFYERQVMELDDLIGEELKEMGKNVVDERLYMQKDFICISDFSGFYTQYLYATPEAIADKIAALDEKISTRDFPFEEKRIRETLANYAKDNNFKIEIPNVESVEQRRKQEQDIFSFKGSGLSFFDRDMLPDDPTARPKVELEDSLFEIIYKISEGVPGAMVGIAKLMKSDKEGFMLLLGLDDMNIRGSQIWEAYKYLYNEDANKFAEAVKNRDEKMVNFINEEMASVGGEKAVTGGASFDRNKDPNKYRFTETEVEQLKTQREERLKRQKEAREKMIANSPVKKKSLGQKKREAREAKRKAYRERLITMGKKSIGELDEELTDLQTKEQQAKELYEQYEEQLPEKNEQEL